MSLKNIITPERQSRFLFDSPTNEEKVESSFPFEEQFSYEASVFDRMDPKNLDKSQFEDFVCSLYKVGNEKFTNMFFSELYDRHKRPVYLDLTKDEMKEACSFCPDARWAVYPPRGPGDRKNSISTEEFLREPMYYQYTKGNDLLDIIARKNDVSLGFVPHQNLLELVIAGFPGDRDNVFPFFDILGKHDYRVMAFLNLAELRLRPRKSIKDRVAKFFSQLTTEEKIGVLKMDGFPEDSRTHIDAIFESVKKAKEYEEITKVMDLYELGAPALPVALEISEYKNLPPEIQAEYFAYCGSSVHKVSKEEDILEIAKCEAFRKYESLREYLCYMNHAFHHVATSEKTKRDLIRFTSFVEDIDENYVVGCHCDLYLETGLEMMKHIVLARLNVENFVQTHLLKRNEFDSQNVQLYETIATIAYDDRFVFVVTEATLIELIGEFGKDIVNLLRFQLSRRRSSDSYTIRLKLLLKDKMPIYHVQ